MNESLLKKNWLDALPKVCFLFMTEEDLSKLDLDGQALSLLEILPQILPSKEKTEKSLLKVYEVRVNYITSNNS